MNFLLPLDKKFITAPVLLLLVICTIHLSPLNSHFEFNRELINSGQWWLIFSGQFTHANIPHLALNSLGIVFIWLLHGEYCSSLRYSLNIVCMALLTGLAIYGLAPDIAIYTGLSGVLHGVILWGALKDIQLCRKDGVLLFIGILVKLGYEQFAGPSESMSNLIESTVAIDAHLYGALSGLLIFLILDLKLRRSGADDSM
ncbi:putative rhomboid family protein [Pseudoalteromonas luteoviolacea B = ATCC 29581]|nr:putative rhomboid family protein [Pseudoalteromonas luteoviolacea B = ATCC 29581]